MATLHVDHFEGFAAHSPACFDAACAPLRCAQCHASALARDPQGDADLGAKIAEATPVVLAWTRRELELKRRGFAQINPGGVTINTTLRIFRELGIPVEDPYPATATVWAPSWAIEIAGNLPLGLRRKALIRCVQDEKVRGAAMVVLATGGATALHEFFYGAPARFLPEMK